MTQSDITVHFWGVRGNLPVPGADTLKYGGNTCCVTLNIANSHWLIFDAGSGIKKFGEYLIKNDKLPVKAKLFISHAHWDHINAIPYFDPFYRTGSQFEIYGASFENVALDKLIFGQMDKVHFPVTIKEMTAQISFHSLEEESISFDNIDISTMKLNHPGKCFGYRLQYNNKIFCYITDNELPLKEDPLFSQTYVDKLGHFIHGADILVTDTAYTDQEYIEKVGWGHSCLSQVIDLADKAKVKQLCLFHHSPHQRDHEIDLKLQISQKMLMDRNSKTQCIAPREGDELSL